MHLAQVADIVKDENDTNTIVTKGRKSLLQALKMLGKGYFLITLIGILSFTLLFFILWFL